MLNLNTIDFNNLKNEELEMVKLTLFKWFNHSPYALIKSSYEKEDLVFEALQNIIINNIETKKWKHESIRYWRKLLNTKKRISHFDLTDESKIESIDDFFEKEEIDFFENLDFADKKLLILKKIENDFKDGKFKKSQYYEKRKKILNFGKEEIKKWQD